MIGFICEDAYGRKLTGSFPQKELTEKLPEIAIQPFWLIFDIDNIQLFNNEGLEYTDPKIEELLTWFDNARPE